MNGKSKGQAYVDFESSAAASTVKHLIESLAEEKPGPEVCGQLCESLAKSFQRRIRKMPQPGRRRVDGVPTIAGHLISQLIRTITGFEGEVGAITTEVVDTMQEATTTIEISREI